LLHYHFTGKLETLSQQCLSAKELAYNRQLRLLQHIIKIPIRFIDIELGIALELSHNLNIYAYDAYVIGCSLKHNAALLSLD